MHGFITRLSNPFKRDFSPPQDENRPSPPLPNAGQLSVSKVTWSGAQVGGSSHTPMRDSSSFTEDEYDEDPWDLLLLRGLIAREDEERETECGANCLGSSPHLDARPGCQCQKGPFGLRRLCYHYRPQVKRCNSNTRRNISLQSPYGRRRRPVFKHDGAHTFSFLLRFENSTCPPAPPLYERVLWRLSDRQWVLLLHSLSNSFGESVLMDNFTPVSFSLRRIVDERGPYPPRLTLSETQDSFGGERIASRSLGDYFYLLLFLCFYCLFLLRAFSDLCSLLHPSIILATGVS